MAIHEGTGDTATEVDHCHETKPTIRGYEIENNNASGNVCGGRTHTWEAVSAAASPAILYQQGECSIDEHRGN
jgi:hypothetical protein